MTTNLNKYDITKHILIFITLIIAIYWAFFPGISGSYYSDDFCYRVHDAATSPIYFLFNKNPLHGSAYRPLEFITLWFTQAISGYDTTLQHSIQILLHLLITFLLYSISQKLGLSKRSSIIASLFMLFSQSSVSAVSSNDTISQLYGTLFGFLSIYILYKDFREESSKKQYHHIILSVLFYAIALFSKELSLGFLITIVSLISYFAIKHNKIKSNILKILPFILVTIFYLIFRSSLELSTGQFGSERYDLNIGFNLIKNTILLLVQAFIPFSSADIFIHIKNREFQNLILPILLTLSTIIVPLYGFIKEKRFKELLLLLFFYLSIMSAAIGLNHVSELYTYQVLPIFAIFIGSGYAMIYKNIQSKKIRQLLNIWITSIIIINISACHSKSNLLTIQGNQGINLHPQLKIIIDDHQINDTLYFVNKSYTPEYSIYYKREFNNMKSGLIALTVMNNKFGLQMIVIHKDDIDSTIKDFSNYYMLNDNDSIVSYN